jgi:Sec-independent protein translocase protein TatA
MARALGQAMTEFRKGMVSGVPEAKTEPKAEPAKDEKSQAG